MTISPLANRFLAMAGEDSRANWKVTADLIQRAGRFVLSPEVVKLSMRVPEPEKLLPAVVQGIRLPHDPCWIEYSPAEVFNNRAEAARQFGLVFWRDDAGDVCSRIIVRKRISDLIRPGDTVADPDAMAVVLYPCDLVFRAGGAVTRETQSDVPKDSMADYRVAAEGLGWLGLTFVLLMTARNTPLLVGEAENIERLNKQRVKSGKPRLVTARPIQWNLSREERRAVRAGVPFDRTARSAALGHMVRGHMKVRKSGVFWWSPHYRNAGDDDVGSGRDYAVH